METACSIDKLVILGRVTLKLQDYLQTHLNYLDACKPVWSIERYGNAKQPYRWWFQFTDGSFLQIAEGRPGVLPAIRLEFNPNRVDLFSGGVNSLVQLIRYLRFGRFSRVDIAIDYFADLSQVRWDDLTKHKRQVEFRAPDGRRETLYIGSRASENMVRIYDKEKESKSLDGRLWWRVEAELKFKGDEVGPLVFMRPFSDLKGYLGLNVSGLNWRDRIVLERLAVDSSIFHEMGYDSRSKYRAMLNKYADSELNPQPQSVYELYWSRIWSELCGIRDKFAKGHVQGQGWQEIGGE